MSTTKNKRSNKSQLGQFITPSNTACSLVERLHLSLDSTVLEPGCGDGSFVISLIDKFLTLYNLDVSTALDLILTRNITAIEMDPVIYSKLLENIQTKYGYLPERHNLILGDFLTAEIKPNFDFIIGNPPFGGTLDHAKQDWMDREYGKRGGKKIKKESYSFFLVKSLDLLAVGGELTFICSDTFLTIKTMAGLRYYLMDQGCSQVDKLVYFSDETSYPMVVLKFSKTGKSDGILLDGEEIQIADMELTGNFSWSVNKNMAVHFDGPKLSEFITCTGGMTTGKNEFFVREINDGKIIEEYLFNYFGDPITLKREIERARLGQISDKKRAEIEDQEGRGVWRRNVAITKMQPKVIDLPHPDYCYYNRSTKGIFYSRPSHVIYWKDDGDAVMTFKRNGNWYLHGVGGKSYFKREGFTWNLVASRLFPRFLPDGYILDSGAPCGFLKEGVPRDELFFIIGWCVTDLATKLLKECINHTMNIQGKDVERLPYPHWVDRANKNAAIILVKDVIADLIEVPEDKAIDENMRKLMPPLFDIENVCNQLEFLYRRN